MNGKFSKFIFRNDIKSLAMMPFHRDVPCIERYSAENFPVHVAIHKVIAASNVAEYTASHSHDMHELNILLGDDGALEYSVMLGDEKYTVCSNSSIWIPRGLVHSANVIRGSGYFIVVRFNRIPAEFEGLAERCTGKA